MKGKFDCSELHLAAKVLNNNAGIVLESRLLKLIHCVEAKSKLIFASALQHLRVNLQPFKVKLNHLDSNMIQLGNLTQVKGF